MPIFHPPKRANAIPFPPTHPSHKLFKYYGGLDKGITVYKDALGVWREAEYQQEQQAEYRVYNDDAYTRTVGPENLSTAQRILHGGAEHVISDVEAAELIAAGYSIQGHWETEEEKWYQYALNSEVNNAYKGGDGCASLFQPATGESIWLFADNFIGSNNPDGTYIFALPASNALIRRNNTTGAIIGQVYNNFGATQPWLLHANNPTQVYWPIDLCHNLDDNDTVVACWDVTRGVGNFGRLNNNALVTLNVFGGVASITDVPVPNNNFWVHGLWEDTTYIYILGLEYDTTRGAYNAYWLDTKTLTRMARIPKGQLLTYANWEYWNGLTWVTDQTAASPILDTNYSPIVGDTALTKAGDNYILASLYITSSAIRFYYSTNPQGPYRYYYSQNIEHGGKPVYGGMDATYLPKFHEHLNPSSTTLVMTYNVNVFASSEPFSRSNIRTYTPKFIYVPTPDNVFA